MIYLALFLMWIIGFCFGHIFNSQSTQEKQLIEHCSNLADIDVKTLLWEQKIAKEGVLNGT